MIALVSALISFDSLLAGLHHVSRAGDGEPASDIRQAQEKQEEDDGSEVRQRAATSARSAPQSPPSDIECLLWRDLSQKKKAESQQSGTNGPDTPLEGCFSILCLRAREQGEKTSTVGAQKSACQSSADVPAAASARKPPGSHRQEAATGETGLLQIRDLSATSVADGIGSCCRTQRSHCAFRRILFLHVFAPCMNLVVSSHLIIIAIAIGDTLTVGRLCVCFITLLCWSFWITPDPTI
jgi:hypothetical protein